MATKILEDLVRLSQALGSNNQPLAILAEGNVSGVADEESFWVKASGMNLGRADISSFVLVKSKPIMDSLLFPPLTDADTKSVLTSALVESDTHLRPSVETFMHAYLLNLPEVNFVGHTHPTPLLSLLATEGAHELAKQRVFPDEVVCCGPATAFVEYVDPGLALALAIRTAVETFVEEWGTIPKTIWLQNHGLIALGKSCAEVESATLMALKSAQVWLGALSTHRKLRPLTKSQVERIHTRPDEHYRQNLLWTIKS